MSGFKVRRPAVGRRLNESGWRESNPHLKAWKACARPSNCTRVKRSAGIGPEAQNDPRSGTLQATTEVSFTRAKSMASSQATSAS